MKNQIYTGLLFFFLLSLTSCASTMSMLIDVEKPAAVTLPVTVQDVIIVNNALPQPVGYGLNAPSGKNPYSDSAYVETLQTAPWRVVNETFKHLDDSKFFSNVSYYKKNLRENDEWLNITPLKEEVRNDFLEGENFDLLISIDRLLFNSGQAEQGKIDALLTFSAYLRGQDRPVIQSTIADSLRIYFQDTYFYDITQYFDYEEFTAELIRYSCINLGERLGDFFIPTWDSAERIFFTKNLSDAAKISDYINGNNWIDAQLAWIKRFESEEKAVAKAKLATNIALSYELNNEFIKAEEWAKKALIFFQTASSKKYLKEINYLTGYVETMQERKRNNKKLDEQYGISEERQYPRY